MPNLSFASGHNKKIGNPLAEHERKVPTPMLKEAALYNAREASSDARITLEETRTVNKKEVLCLKIDGTLKGIAFRYYGYYYGSKEGSIQLLAYTGQNLFAKYEQDILELLNGLEVIDVAK